MDEHPDLHRMRRETHELRIADAWGVATQGRELSENARARLEAFVAPFLHKRKEMHPRRTAPPRVKQTKHVKVTSPTVGEPVVVMGCIMTPMPQDRVVFETLNAKFKTSPVLISSIPSEGGNRIYRAHFNINPTDRKPFRVTSPPIKTMPANHATLRRFLNWYMFEMYVRLMSRVRLYLHMENTEVELLPVDVCTDQAWVSGIELTLPPVLQWTITPNTPEECIKCALAVCYHLGIPTPSLHSDDSTSESSESESE